MGHRLTSAGLLGAIAACLILTSCTNADGNTSSGLTAPTAASASEQVQSFGTYSDFEAEYVRAADQLNQTMPDGMKLPASVSGSWDPEGRYEEGAGDMQAAFIWQCAWLQEYTTAREQDDSKRREVALQHLEAWPDLLLVSPHIDAASRHAWLNDYVLPAGQGDDGSFVKLAEEC